MYLVLMSGIKHRMNSQSLQQNPILPAYLQMPVRLAPAGLRNKFFVIALNRFFKQELEDDELDFLAGKTVAIKVRDARLDFKFTLQGKAIKTCHSRCVTDLSIEGTVYDFLLLVSRREDPDTLFFNRRLKLNGDTELGLFVKNFLDALDLSSRWKYLQPFSEKLSRIAERLG